MTKTNLPVVLNKYSSELLQEWISEQIKMLSSKRGVMKEAELKEQCLQFLRLLAESMHSNNVTDIYGSSFAGLRDLLSSISQSRGLQGFSPAETATFVFSFKKPLFNRLRGELVSRPEELASDMWVATELLDSLGLFTTEVHQRAREDVISRQQRELLELSTPVVKLWNGILALPMIGTLDSSRTQTAMESLLQKIVETGSDVAIIDITGVPTVDTLVAQHLIKTVTAARLMGADCIISGIRPQIAQTIVHLGVQLGDVTTKASLADAFSIALQRRGLTICRASTVDKR